MELDSPISFQRNGQYMYKVPTPPRIHVPPPALNAEALPVFQISQLSNAPFFTGVKHDNLVTHNALLDWSYERRHQAQMILPYVYLGPISAAKDRLFLQSQGITMLLGIQRFKEPMYLRRMNNVLGLAEEMGLANTALDLLDEQQIIASFPKVTKIINDHLSDNHAKRQLSDQTDSPEMGKVLVFCENGNERSACVVAAYIMEMFKDVDYVKAMQLCQAQRFCVNFDDQLKNLLQCYWGILQAKRAVGDTDTAMGTMQLSVRAKATKRSHIRDDDEEVVHGVDEVDDDERFKGRRGTYEPFVDVA